jgi:citrate synthase
MTDWLSAEEAQRRLGVRAQTLYAYVSRGRIRAAADPADPRRSRYRASDVGVLAERKARGRKAAEVARGAIAWGEPVLASAITTVRDGHLYYRGRDAVVLAKAETLEHAARLLRRSVHTTWADRQGARLRGPGHARVRRSFGAGPIGGRPCR